ncbi:MAG: phenylalanine--tRNA ligase subunit beta [Thermoproteota archaeon]|nr:phenylalanine--tRNA ligase subunit beta [Thermoproteota archaeon]
MAKSFPGASLEQLIDKLPYIGLDIEGIDDESEIIRVEFNPNRPDFSSENGIIRALKGLLETDTGIPMINNIQESDIFVMVDEGLKDIRQFVVAVIAKRQRPLTEHETKQLISMQEDLHNGVGRKRKKSSIGIHDLDSIKFPIFYTTKNKDFSFKPLNQQKEFTIKEILKDLDIGKEYGYIVKGFPAVPVLIDSNNNVLSFPPVINGESTRMGPKTNNIFVEVTSTNKRSAEDMLSILSFELHDMGFQIIKVNIDLPMEGIIKTPDLKPIVMQIADSYINSVLGLGLTKTDIIKSIEKSRCSAKIMENGLIECLVPKYRIDIFHPIDICEEVAIGYGINQLSSYLPDVYLFGKKSRITKTTDNIREILVGLGFIEIINSSIISKEVLLNYFSNSDMQWEKDILYVENTKNSQFDALRSSVVPSMMATLSINIHEKYPQKLFEIGKIFHVKNSRIVESLSLGVVIAHNNTDYSEIKSVLQSLTKHCFNKEIITNSVNYSYFLEGHSAEVIMDEKVIGKIGEIHPYVLENFKLRTPVSAFQINLDFIINALKL